MPADSAASVPSLFISYHYRSIIGIGLNHQFQYIQEFTGISTRKAKHRVRFLQLDMLLLQNNILGDGDMQEFQQIIFSNDFNTYN